ncbi:MAG: hypothetical protein JOY82_11235 [Streptosporangiaceae bacterium]|nr:hypothetical protein [Streptosporangiaceae bacterium]MBV9855071.1 hypothetical protein [Streptosporangiaceae bacterium]
MHYVKHLRARHRPRIAADNRADRATEMVPSEKRRGRGMRRRMILTGLILCLLVPGSVITAGSALAAECGAQSCDLHGPYHGDWALANGATGYVAPDDTQCGLEGSFVVESVPVSWQDPDTGGTEQGTLQLMYSRDCNANWAQFSQGSYATEGWLAIHSQSPAANDNLIGIGPNWTDGSGLHWWSFTTMVDGRYLAQACYSISGVQQWCTHWH